ncbi:hypothetical protein TomMM35A_29080 [Sphingobium sp. TomMM35A]
MEQMASGALFDDDPSQEQGWNPSVADTDGRAAALLDLLALLKARGYHFITPTPATHARLIERAPLRRAHDLRDVFGWSLPFDADLLEPELLHILDRARALEQHGDGLKSRFRVSSLGPDLLLHSAYPTDDQDAIFFGPDSYRFARLISDELSRCPQRDGARLVDMGTGAGVGGIVAAHHCPRVEIIMTDVNPAALRLARINAQAAGVDARFCEAGDLSPIGGTFDLLLANPPYIVDSAGRAYRDGGGMHGAEISLTMARQAVPRLADDGRFILYTGSAIVGGNDELKVRLASLAQEHDCLLRYAEIDPDVFGEELENPAYADVERIALISAVIERRAASN